MISFDFAIGLLWSLINTHEIFYLTHSRCWLHSDFYCF